MTTTARDAPEEWDAGIYHRVSAPQVAWGSKVLGRLTLARDETVVNAGCGSGRLTADLLERVPRGRVIAVDQSTNMLAEAAAHLLPSFIDRVSFLKADVQDLVLPEPVDAIFSTATFHWVLDHPRLFRTLFTCLKPGGRIVAQCGGGPNIARLRLRAESLIQSVESVVLRAHLDAPDDADHREFMVKITALAAEDNPAFTLDYWRLNLAATRPLLS